MNWKEIYEKTPKARDEFFIWLKETYGWTLGNDIKPFTNQPLEMQSGVLEKFFDEQGLHVTTHFDEQRKNPWHSAILVQKSQPHHLQFGKEIDHFANRADAMVAVFERAFEILESKLPK